MDIFLATETRDPSFAFRKIEKFDDGSGYACFLSVRSGWLLATYKFWFEVSALQSFIGKLEDLNRTLGGSALLKPLYEPQFVEFSGDGRGHITVCGDLIEHGAKEQRVVFSFATDQTCLKPLIVDLQVLAKPQELWPAAPTDSSMPDRFDGS